ncbi:MAG: AAA family ATPase [Deltaproteobacteria bacterium]|nr:AAA family ATPase [Deltaproteobacteria bacterium]
MTRIRALPTTMTNSHRTALELVRSHLKCSFLERDDVIDGLLSALVAKQHVLLLGPPGTAKSLLVNALTNSIDGAACFSWLLTKFSTPEEIFGPISLAALQQDRVSRITTGKVPEAHVAFLDEIFKSNSAILNALLTLVNERVFYNDGKAVPCPLVSVVGASNELPEGVELEALFDRFLVRYWVPYLTEPRNIRALFGGLANTNNATMTLAELETCQAEASKVNVPDSIIDAVIGIKLKTEEQGFRSSDRRWRQLIDLLKARAYLEGDDVVGDDHLEILSDALWREPKDRPAIAALIGTVANPLNVRATEILDAAKESVGKLGAVDAKDVTGKAEWLKNASLVESRLGDMEAELSQLVQQSGKKSARRAKEVLGSLGNMKTDITKRVATLYRL